MTLGLRIRRRLADRLTVHARIRREFKIARRTKRGLEVRTRRDVIWARAFFKFLIAHLWRPTTASSRGGATFERVMGRRGRWSLQARHARRSARKSDRTVLEAMAWGEQCRRVHPSSCTCDREACRLRRMRRIARRQAQLEGIEIEAAS